MKRWPRSLKVYNYVRLLCNTQFPVMLQLAYSKRSFRFAINKNLRTIVNSVDGDFDYNNANYNEMWESKFLLSNISKCSITLDLCQYQVLVSSSQRFDPLSWYELFIMYHTYSVLLSIKFGRFTSIKTVISAINTVRLATGLIAPSKMRFAVLNINKDRIYCSACCSIVADSVLGFVIITSLCSWLRLRLPLQVT